VESSPKTRIFNMYAYTRYESVYLIYWVNRLKIEAPWNSVFLWNAKHTSDWNDSMGDERKYSDTSANEDNSFRNHIR